MRCGACAWHRTVLAKEECQKCESLLDERTAVVDTIRISGSIRHCKAVSDLGYMQHKELNSDRSRIDHRKRQKQWQYRMPSLSS